MKRTMKPKFNVGMNFRSIAAIGLASACLMFTACEKEASVLNPEQGVNSASSNPSDVLTAENQLLIDKATEIENLLQNNLNQNSLLPLNMDYITCEAILNKQLCNNKKAYDLVNTRTRFNNIFSDGVLSSARLIDFIRDVEEWVELENILINDFKGNYLIDLTVIEDEIEVELVQMYGNQLVGGFGGRPNDNYNSDDHYTVLSEQNGGGRVNNDCLQLDNSAAAPDIIELRINRVLNRVFYEGYYVNIQNESVTPYHSPVYCTGDLEQYKSFLYTTDTDFDNCNSALSPLQMKYHTNGYYDYENVELRCGHSEQDFIYIDCQFDQLGNSNLIRGNYRFGTFIANPIINVLSSFP